MCPKNTFIRSCCWFLKTMMLQSSRWLLLTQGHLYICKPWSQQLLKSLRTRPAHPQPADTERACCFFSEPCWFGSVTETSPVWWFLSCAFSSKAAAAGEPPKCIHRHLLVKLRKYGVFSPLILLHLLLERNCWDCHKDKYFRRYLFEHLTSEWIFRASISLSIACEKFSCAAEFSCCKSFLRPLCKGRKGFSVWEVVMCWWPSPLSAGVVEPSLFTQIEDFGR